MGMKDEQSIEQEEATQQQGEAKIKIERPGKALHDRVMQGDRYETQAENSGSGCSALPQPNYPSFLVYLMSDRAVMVAL